MEPQAPPGRTGQGGSGIRRRLCGVSAALAQCHAWLRRSSAPHRSGRCWTYIDPPMAGAQDPRRSTRMECRRHWTSLGCPPAIEASKAPMVALRQTREAAGLDSKATFQAGSDTVVPSRDLIQFTCWPDPTVVELGGAPAGSGPGRAQPYLEMAQAAAAQAHEAGRGRSRECPLPVLR